MSRKEGQKRKLLVLLEILARETDEKHPLSVPQLVEKLQEHGVVAERKSVYDDLNTLNNLPDTKYEIVQQRGRGGGYYMTEAPFELAELKLLVDAVYASKFITARKSKILIDKLGQFTSTYRQEELDRKVLVSGRIKSTDEKIPVITNFTDEDGNDRMKETVQANYRRIKEEVKQIVQEELERIKNDPVLCKLLPDNETV